MNLEDTFAYTQDVINHRNAAEVAGQLGTAGFAACSRRVRAHLWSLHVDSDSS